MLCSLTEKNCLCHHGCLQEYHYTDVSTSLASDAVLEAVYSRLNATQLRSEFTRAALALDSLADVSAETALIARFNASLGGFFDTWTRFSASLTSLKSTLATEAANMQPRLRFHGGVALAGLQTTVRRKFSAAWRTLDSQYLRGVGVNTLELAAVVNRSVALMKSSVADRPYIYVNLYAQLGVKMDIAEEILKTLTNVYIAYLTSQPARRYNVTPLGRYDDNLIPMELITSYGNEQKLHYTEFSNLLGNYVKEVANMRNIVREVYRSGRVNDTAVELTINNYVTLSAAIENYRHVFNDQVVMPIENDVNRKVATFRDVSSAYELSSERLSAAVGELLAYTLSMNDSNSKLAKLKDMAQFTSAYVTHANVSKRDLADNYLSSDVRMLLSSANELLLEVIARVNGVFALLDDYRSALHAAWSALLGDDALSRFYFQLHTDVTAMQENPGQTQFYLELFSSEQMLNISTRNRSELVLRQFTTLLNADVPVLYVSHKLQAVNVSVRNYHDSINYKSVVHQSLLLVQERYAELQRHLAAFNSRLSVDTDTFARYVNVSMIHVITGLVAVTSLCGMLHGFYFNCKYIRVHVYLYK